MAVEFKANIEENGIGGWCIRLIDTLDEESKVCSDLDIFSNEIENMGAKYAGDIKVVWSKDENVTPEHFAEVQQAIAKVQKELNETV